MNGRGAFDINMGLMSPLMPGGPILGWGGEEEIPEDARFGIYHFSNVFNNEQLNYKEVRNKIANLFDQKAVLANFIRIRSR